MTMMTMMTIMTMMTMMTMMMMMTMTMKCWLERVWTWGRHEYSKKQLPGLIGREAPLHGDDDCNDGGFIQDNWTDPF